MLFRTTMREKHEEASAAPAATHASQWTSQRIARSETQGKPLCKEKIRVAHFHLQETAEVQHTRSDELPREAAQASGLLLIRGLDLYSPDEVFIRLTALKIGGEIGL